MTDLLVRLFIKDKDNVTDPLVRQKYGTMGGCVGIACNIFLFLIKILGGWLTGAISIMADAFNNLSDAASSVITLIGFRMAGKPADKDHPFGHGRIEYISGMIVSFLIILMGFELLKTSIDKIIHPEEITFRMISVVILVVSILVKFWMAAFNKSVGIRINSEAMKATATDSLSDCISTTAVLIGILLFHFLGWNVDGIVGVIVSCFVMWAGVDAAKDTLQPLLGEAPDSEFVMEIQRMVMDHDMVVGVHDMMIHDYGPGRCIISLHAEVPHTVDILEAHDVIDNIEFQLMEQFQCDATIHMDPIVMDDAETDAAKQLVLELIGKRDENLSIHDFRMVKGNTHTNLIFDMIVPYEDMEHAEEIVAWMKTKLHKKHPTFFAVIKVDQGYI
ncbi:MAG: cation diffusion facilitator family transporter [Anaerostipes sp.]|nr:cation diffusion facilitator family transporter [Anaerostipes sp.]